VVLVEVRRDGAVHRTWVSAEKDITLVEIGTLAQGCKKVYDGIKKALSLG